MELVMVGVIVLVSVKVCDDVFEAEGVELPLGVSVGVELTETV